MPRTRQKPPKGVQHVHTLLQLTIASGIEGVPHGTIKLVRGILRSGERDGQESYAIFVDDQFLGELPEEEAPTERDAILAALGRMEHILEFLCGTEDGDEEE